MSTRFRFSVVLSVAFAVLVLSVSIPLGFLLVSRQRSSLISEFVNRADVLLGAMASGAEMQVRQQEEGLFAAQDLLMTRTSMPEALFATISGPDRSFKPTDPKDFVWASDEKRFDNEYEAGHFNRAAETVDDTLARSVVPSLQRSIDDDCRTRLAPLLQQYQGLRAERAKLLSSWNAESKVRFAGLTSAIVQVSRNIDSRAKALHAGRGTLETFSPESRLLPTYLFYKPIIFYNRAADAAEATFYQGMVRLQISTDTLITRIDESKRLVVISVAVIDDAAFILGILASIVIARIFFPPRRRTEMT
jgi:hypothetical protein